MEAMCTTCSGSKILMNGEFDSFLILQAIYFVEKCEVMFSTERLKTWIECLLEKLAWLLVWSQQLPPATRHSFFLWRMKRNARVFIGTLTMDKKFLEALLHLFTFLTWNWISVGTFCPHSVFTLAEARTDNESCAAWLISPFNRNSSTSFSGPRSKFSNSLVTCSNEDWQGSSFEDGVTWKYQSRRIYKF